MDNVFEHLQFTIRSTLGLSADVQGKIGLTLLTGAFFILLRGLIVNLVNRRTTDAHARYHWRKIATYVCFGISFLVTGRIWVEGFESVSTFLGLLSAGIAIALKDPIGDIAGWAFILWREPFKVGDRIEVGGTKGDVVDVSLFQFTLLEVGNWVGADQSTGRLVHVPNKTVFMKEQANYTKGFNFIWDEIEVVITLESDWKEAKKALLEIANEHCEKMTEEASAMIKQAAKRYMIFYRKLTPIVFTSVVGNGIKLTIRYLCQPKKRRSTATDIWESVLNLTQENPSIALAYPTERIVIEDDVRVRSH